MLDLIPQMCFQINFGGFYAATGLLNYSLFFIKTLNDFGKHLIALLPSGVQMVDPRRLKDNRVSTVTK